MVTQAALTHFTLAESHAQYNSVSLQGKSLQRWMLFFPIHFALMAVS